MGADCHLDVLHEWRDVVERHLEDNRARIRVRVRARGRVRVRVRGRGRGRARVGCRLPPRRPS